MLDSLLKQYKELKKTVNSLAKYEFKYGIRNDNVKLNEIIDNVKHEFEKLLNEMEQVEKKVYKRVRRSNKYKELIYDFMKNYDEFTPRDRVIYIDEIFAMTYRYIKLLDYDQTKNETAKENIKFINRYFNN